jgi:hypothetical protein
MKRLNEFWAERGRAQEALNAGQSDADSATLYPTETELSPAAEQPASSTWPAEVAAAHAHYKARVENQDWGTVRVYRVPTAGPITYAVRVRTDGDDGYLEVYDEGGGFLVAGRTEVGSIAWCSRDGLRAQVGQSYPPDLEWDKPFAEE